MNINPEVTPNKCIPQEININNVRLARAYVPFQKLCNTYTPLGALRKGTAFPPLYNAYGWERREEFQDE